MRVCREGDWVTEMRGITQHALHQLDSRHRKDLPRPASTAEQGGRHPGVGACDRN